MGDQQLRAGHAPADGSARRPRGPGAPGPVVSALLAGWPAENLRKARESGGLIDPEDVADAIVFMLTRKRTVTIRDMVILPSNFDRV